MRNILTTDIFLSIIFICVKKKALSPSSVIQTHANIAYFYSLYIVFLYNIVLNKN